MTYDVRLHPGADDELGKLPVREKRAVITAMDKLRELGASLPFPHSSNIQGAEDLRELRPRAGRSPWRAFYRKVGAVFVVAAIGPEAEQDSRGFYRAVDLAEQRLDELEDDE